MVDTKDDSNLLLDDEESKDSITPQKAKGGDDLFQMSMDAKQEAQQMQKDLRNAVWPFNFGLSDRSGTDSAVHYMQYLTDRYPDRVVVSIDGIGAFDHICRARIFEQLLARPALHDVLPFVRMWCSEQSRFVWVDDEGVSHGEHGGCIDACTFQPCAAPSDVTNAGQHARRCCISGIPL